MPLKHSISGSLLANPSYGQVYIDASREDLTRVAGNQSGPGAARETLPQDLETFLMEDNKVTLRLKLHPSRCTWLLEPVE